MNVTGVTSFNSAVGMLNGISGNVTTEQLGALTDLFSSQIWNTEDSAETSASLERQIKELKALLDNILADINKLYEKEKDSNAKMSDLVNKLNDESYQASKQADKNIREQKDLVAQATDDAYSAYLNGEIEKNEIPKYIANQLAKTNPKSAQALQSHLSAMDAQGKAIYDLSGQIAEMLDSLNQFKSKYKTTEASIGMMEKLKAMIPQHNTRADIAQTIERPYFSPSQEALGDKLIDKFKVAQNGGADTNGYASQGTTLLGEALKGSGTVDKAKLDAMSEEEKAAAVEECDLSKYSALELLYMSGMNETQAASAIGTIFSGAYVGYKEGKLHVPAGHADTGTNEIYSTLRKQYKELWGGGNLVAGAVSEGGKTLGADPFGYRKGDTNYLFAVDRNQDGRFTDAGEFVGAENGVAELRNADVDHDGKLTAEEMEKAGIYVIEANQALTNGGNYGFNGVKESGIEFIDLNSYKEIDEIKSENINGNKRVAEFDITVDGEKLLGKQTENQEDYNRAFYSHMYNEAFSFGLDAEFVSATLKEAAEPQDYMANERHEIENKEQQTENIINEDERELTEKTETIESIRNQGATNTGIGLSRDEETEETEETEENKKTEETEDNETNTENNNNYKEFYEFD